MPTRKSLDLYDIHIVPSLEEAKKNFTCPESIYVLFELIAKSQTLEANRLIEEWEEREPNTAHKYELSRRQQADDLVHKCVDIGAKGWPEMSWIKHLGPHVFHDFERMLAEKLDAERPFHYCLACRRIFPPNTRPIINNGSTRETRARKPNAPKPGETRRTDYDECEDVDLHSNLPNLDYADQLTYLDDDHHNDGSSKLTSETPDATLGLCTYDLSIEPWISRNDLMDNDMVRLFDKKSLRGLLEHFDLKTPYKNKDINSVVTMSYPMFSFGLWEAKKTFGDNNDIAFTQTVRKLATLLRWQRMIFNKAKCKYSVPLVWSFTSVGSKWEIYGCYECKKTHGKEYKYPMVHLWSGNTAILNSAVQLFYVLDIIRLWAEYTYKPIIAACLRQLEAMKNAEDPLPLLEDTFKKRHIAVNKTNMPWLFQRHRTSRAKSSLHSTNGRLEVPVTTRSPARRSSDTALPQSNTALAPRPSSSQEHRRSPSPIADRCAFPEIDSYYWLLDRDPGKGDLLLIRIDENGTRRKPLVIFDSLDGSIDWDDGRFRLILKDETMRRHSDVTARFTIDRKKRHYLWNCTRSELPYIRRGIQFCAILPLNREEDRQQRTRSSKKNVLFEPLESLLKIPSLLGKIDDAYDQWCTCNPESSANKASLVEWIECNNATCAVQWYHKECVKLPNDDPLPYWICKACRALPQHQRIDTEDIDTEYDEIAEASSQRAHRTRSVAKAWKDHKWPSAAEIRREFKEIAMNLDVVKSAAYPIYRKGVQRDLEPPRYWVVDKLKPEKLIMAGPMKKQPLYHPDVTDAGEEDNESSGPDGNGLYDDDTIIDDVEDALDGMSLGRNYDY
ncbi:hypothetical protein MMC17_007653 [Xylographa soralifera]|nr:hypothetical protein [Xylographa soralifera]